MTMLWHRRWLFAHCSIHLVVQDHVSHFLPIFDQFGNLAGIIHRDGFAQIHLETAEIQILEESIHQPDLLVIRRGQERSQGGADPIPGREASRLLRA